ncbi:hypothetical protein BDR26DRAFT_867801 [Obelidium mucronatum]|nr:hypothetical protein BDR26DRAFT_867801 [Obelidium mucronatum]
MKKQLSSTHLETLSRLSSFNTRLQVVTNSLQKFHTSINNTPDEILTQIFSWIDSRTVFKFRRLSRRVDTILTTAHFAVLNQTKYDTMIQEELKTCLTNMNAKLGSGLSRAFALGPLSFQTMYAHQYLPLLKKFKTLGWDFDRMLISNPKWKPAFSKSLCNLDWIEELFVDGVCGPIPEEISRLTKINKLQISKSSVGVIPIEIFGLAKLRYLDLCDCQLTGIIPKELVTLVSLQCLFLENNRLEGPLPENLGNLRSLFWLYLSNNRLSGELPASIGELLDLRYLILTGNNFTGTVPETIGNLSSLERLVMDNNNFTGFLPSTLLHLTNLYECDFRGNARLDCDFIFPLLLL